MMQSVTSIGVTYEETEIAGIPVVEVTPSELASTDNAVYTHGGAYVLNSAKAVIESAMFFAAETGLRVIAVDCTLAPRSKWQDTTDEIVNVLKALGTTDCACQERSPRWPMLPLLGSGRGKPRRTPGG